MRLRPLIVAVASCGLTMVLATPAGAAPAIAPAISSATSPATSPVTSPAYPTSPDWTVPTCQPVDSDGSLTYTKNAGKRLRSTTGTMAPVRYQFALVTLATPDALVSADQSGRLFHSTDAGCTWTAGATLPDMAIPQLEAAPDGTAYAWSINTSHLARVSGDVISPLPDLPTGEASLVAVAVDQADAQHLRAVASDGVVLDSTDGGQRFDAVGSRIGGVYLYDADIDPQDLDHIVAGAQISGVYVTEDAAATWTKVDLGAPGDRVNGFTVEVSPANGQTVYAQGLNITESDSGAPSQGRHIYRSWDGGKTFEVIVDQGGDVILPNGTPLFPSPRKPGKMYWTYGQSYGGYGTDIWRYRQRGHHAAEPLRLQHNGYDDIKAIAFNPSRDRVLYLGLADEPGGGRAAS